MQKIEVNKQPNKVNSYQNIFDLAGISNSIICLIHCALFPVFFQGLVLTHSHSSLKKIELLFLGSIILWGGISFIRGFFWHHHNKKILFGFVLGITIYSLSFISYFHQSVILLHLFGSIIIAISHIYNWYYCRKCTLCKHT